MLEQQGPNEHSSLDRERLQEAQRYRPESTINLKDQTAVANLDIANSPMRSFELREQINELVTTGQLDDLERVMGDVVNLYLPESIKGQIDKQKFLISEQRRGLMGMRGAVSDRLTKLSPYLPDWIIQCATLPTPQGLEIVSNRLTNALAQNMADLDPHVRIVQEYMKSRTIDWTDPKTAIPTIYNHLLNGKKMLEEQKEALVHGSSTDTIPQFRKCHVDLTETEDFLLNGGDPSTCCNADDISLEEKKRLWKWQASVHAHQASKQWGLMINPDDTTVIDTFPHIMETSIQAPEFDAMLAQAATEIKNNIRNPAHTERMMAAVADSIQRDYHSQNIHPRTDEIFNYTQALLTMQNYL
jgi:hypothetical protein